jgi:hypothetical protein
MLLKARIRDPKRRKQKSLQHIHKLNMARDKVRKRGTARQFNLGIALGTLHQSQHSSGKPAGAFKSISIRAYP